MQGNKGVAALAFLVGVVGVLGVAGVLALGSTSVVTNAEMMWLGGLSLALAMFGGAVLFPINEEQDQ